MKNNECIIQIISKKGWKQSYKRDKKGWIQITNGVVRRMTAEQVLSHILPPLAAGNKRGIRYKGSFRLVVKKRGKTGV